MTLPFEQAGRELVKAASPWHLLGQLGCWKSRGQAGICAPRGLSGRAAGPLYMVALGRRGGLGLGLERASVPLTIFPWSQQPQSQPRFKGEVEATPRWEGRQRMCDLLSSLSSPRVSDRLPPRAPVLCSLL